MNISAPTQGEAARDCRAAAGLNAGTDIRPAARKGDRMPGPGLAWQVAVGLGRSRAAGAAGRAEEQLRLAEDRSLVAAGGREGG